LSYIIGQVISLIKLLHSENGAGQIAAGLTLGFLLGLSPLFSIQGLLFILVLLIFRIQIGAALAMSALTKILAIGLVSPLAMIGEQVLELKSLFPLFMTMYNAPVIPLTKFNHTVVMGGLIFSIFLGPILFIIFYQLVKRYQKAAADKINKSKWGKAIKASTLYQLYLKYSNLTK